MSWVYGNQVGNWRCWIDYGISSETNDYADIYCSIYWESVSWGFNVSGNSWYVNANGSTNSGTISVYSSAGQTKDIYCGQATSRVYKTSSDQYVSVSGSFSQVSYQAGTSSASASIYIGAKPVVAPTVTAPSAVTITSFGPSTSDNTKVSVHWENNSSGTGTYTGIRVEYKVDNGDWKTATSNAGASAYYYNIATLTNDTKYDVRVTPYNSAGDGSAQTSTYYSTPPAPELSSMTSLVRYDGNYYGTIKVTDKAKYPNNSYVFYIQKTQDSSSDKLLLGSSQTPSVAIDTSNTDFNTDAKTAITDGIKSVGGNDRLRQDTDTITITLDAGRMATTISNGNTLQNSITQSTTKSFTVPVFDIASAYVNIPDDKTYSGLYINDPNSTNANISVHAAFSGSSSSSSGSSTIGSVDIYQQLDTTAYSDTLAVRNAIKSDGNFRKITNVTFNGSAQATSASTYPIKTNKDVYALFVPSSGSPTYTTSASGCGKLTLNGSTYSGTVTVPA